MTALKALVSAVTLLLSASACKMGDIPFFSDLPSADLTAVAVSDTTPSEGDVFIATARASYANCDRSLTEVQYGSHGMGQSPGASLEASFIADRGVTTVTFDAHCYTTGAAPAVSDHASVYIMVSPLP